MSIYYISMIDKSKYCTDIKKRTFLQRNYDN